MKCHLHLTGNYLFNDGMKPTFTVTVRDTTSVTCFIYSRPERHTCACVAVSYLFEELIHEVVPVHLHHLLIVVAVLSL